MYFNFKTINNGTIKAYVSFEGYRQDAGIMFDNGKSKTEKLYNNENGDLSFRFNGEEIVIRKAETTNVETIRSRIESGEWVTSSDLMLALICDGVENVRFLDELPVPDFVFPGTSIAVCSNQREKCVCKLELEYLFMPHEDYKLKLIAAEPSFVCSGRYYTSDLLSLITRGQIQILDSIQDGKTAEEHLVEYFCKVTEPDRYQYKMITMP